MVSDNRMEPASRRAARLLVIDPQRAAVLLFQYEDAGRSWWATPGGALEGEETFEDAAAREAAEELAVSAPVISPLWNHTVEFSFRGRRVRQEEQYYLLRIAAAAVALGSQVQEAHHREGIVAARWWSLDEIEATSDQLFPEDLPERMRALSLSARIEPAPDAKLSI